MNKLTLRSPAKINLYLEILRKRADGYHNIKTLFERIGLFDTVVIHLIRQDRIEISCDDPYVPADKTNLAYIAANLLKKDFSVSLGVRITIKKRIPVAAGLGGGSSNAAAVLQGLNILWDLKLNKKSLIRYAKKIGADVAFFINDRAFALGTVRGDNIRPLGIKKIFWHVLVMPNIRISTKKAYDAYRQDLRLTKPSFNTKILSSMFNRGRFSDIGSFIYNDLETVALRRHRLIAEIIDTLRNLGVIAGMSGSGSAIFAIVSSKSRAEAIRKHLRRFKGVKIALVKTC